MSDTTHMNHIDNSSGPKPGFVALGSLSKAILLDDLTRQLFFDQLRTIQQVHSCRKEAVYGV